MASPTETLIEIRGIYDGWSVRLFADGTMENRWPVDDRRHALTQEWIELQKQHPKEQTP